MTTATTPQHSLLDALDSLRKRTARFRRVALHIHSPDSHDWNRTGDRALNDKSRLLAAGGETEFLNALNEHFDLVAITDHMKSAYAGRVSSVSCRTDGVLVLPGMEINFRPEAAITSMRLHVLAIWPEGASAEKCGRLFHGLNGIPDDGERSGKEEVTGITLAEWIKRVHDEGGICIAAHVNSQQGVRNHFRQTGRDVIKLLTVDEQTREEQEKDLTNELREYLLSVGFDALEIARPADRRHYRWESTVRGHDVSIPVIMQSDAHCIEDFSRKDKLTWIKLTTPNLKGLRDALKFPETRVRFTSELPSPPSPRLLGIEIVGDNASLFENERIAFAENLNCLIGPRGSGKSTLVEALRYVFGYNRTLKELDTSNKLSDRIRDLQKANLTGCLLRVVYQTRAGEKRLLEATFDPAEDYATKVFSLEGDQLSVADVEKSGDFPLRLFGWSELETLGRDIARQRDLLDRLITELPAAVQERVELRHQLRMNRSDVEKIVAELRGLWGRQNGVIRRYSEYKAAFEKLNTEEVKGHFAELDIANLKLQLLEAVRSSVDSFRTRVAELDPTALDESVDALLENAPQAIRDWWATEASRTLKLADLKGDVQKYLTSIADVLKSLSTQLEHHTSTIKGEIDSIQARIRTSFADDSSMQKIADLRANAERRLREASQVRDEYLKAWKRLREALAERKSVADKLIECHDRIAGIRARYNESTETTLNQYFGSQMKISLRFRAGRDTRAFEEALVKQKIAASFAVQYQKRRIPELLASHFNPITFVRTLLAGDSSAFSNCKLSEDQALEITQTEAERAMESWSGWSHDEAAQVESLTENGVKLLSLMSLQEIEWDDEESILLDDRPVGELSPGQRSSAMLPLIALAESTPLVIDQPEDNLDNRLIGHVLSDILAALKEKRQIIVCTHNPNIVVSGDAEQVIVLNAVSDRKAKVEKHGSIDNDDIIQSVIDIMEGGRDAFRVRQQRYGLEAPAAAIH